MQIQVQELAQVRSSAGTGLLTCIRSLGTDPTCIMRSRESSVAKLGDAGQLMTLAEFAALLEEAAFVTGHHGLGLYFASTYDIRKLGALGYLAFHGETLRECLRDYTTFYGKLQSHTRVDFREENGNAIMTYHVEDDPDYERRQDAEFSIGIISNFARRICGASWRVTSLQFEHEGPNHNHYRELTGNSMLAFGAAENQLVFPAELLKVHNPNSDPDLSAILRSHLQASQSLKTTMDELVDFVRRIITRHLSEGRTTQIRDIATELGWSVRSLQNALIEGGETFQSIKAKATKEIACALLREHSMPITEIALRLGFSETSAFSRSFKNRMGVSPKRYRLDLEHFPAG